MLLWGRRRIILLGRRRRMVFKDGTRKVGGKECS